MGARSHRVAAIAITLIALGAVVIAANILLLGHTMFGRPEMPWYEVPASFQFWELELRIVAMLVGVLSIVSGIALWYGRRRLSFGLSVAAIVVAIGNSPSNNVLRH